MKRFAAMKASTLPGDCCEVIGDASVDYTVRVVFDGEGMLSEVRNWRRARAMAGKPDSLAEFMHHHQRCWCRGWAPGFCEPHALKQIADGYRNTPRHTKP